MLSTDLHIHTSCSKDGESSVQQVLSAAIAAGLDAIAITDHDTMQGYKIARELDTSVLVIPGVEISTREGHVIALGIETAPNHGQPVLDTIKMVQDKG